MLTQYCKAKKILFFPEILVARNIFTQMTANLFFQSIFQIYYLVFFSFFSFFYYFFVCCFLKLKMYIVIHIQLCGRVSIKEIFTQPIFRNKTTFFCTRNVSSMYTTDWCPNVCSNENDCFRIFLNIIMASAYPLDMAVYWHECRR